MNIVVFGAGVTGIATAWYLRKAGHAVTVIDRREGPGLETSFANGGQISVSHAEPWANPRAPLQILRWLGREDAPLLFRLRADWSASQHPPAGGAGQLQPRHAEGLARRDRHPVRPADPRHPALLHQP